MLRCPACGNSDPEKLYLGISLDGPFVNDLLRDRPSAQAVKEYVREALYGEHLQIDCHACWYFGPWHPSEDRESDTGHR